MIILTVIFVALVAFLGGVMVGCMEAPQKAPQKNIEPCEEQVRLEKEYENFLNYDGSVQQ